MTRETVNHPPHYTAHPSGVECITVVEHFNFNVGNAIKYLWRAGMKNALLEDLRKARWYVDREIQRLEADQQGILDVAFAAPIKGEDGPPREIPPAHYDQPMQGFGEWYTVEKFDEMRRTALVMPIDGIGYYGRVDPIGGRFFCRAFGVWQPQRPGDATHVAWFNK